MSKLSKALIAAAGNAGESLYVEDVFSTLLYSDTYASSTVNGIDLANEGGLVWIKKRASVANHFLYDTERGVEKALLSNSTGAEFTATNSLTSFNSDGFSLGTYSNTNSGVAWTFRKAEKFFDVVTYTGNKDTGGSQTISHNLGVAPAVIITKCLSTSAWAVYHASNSGESTPQRTLLKLNETAAYETDIDVWNNTAPTDSVFSVGNSLYTNIDGQQFVAYLFASDAGGFGDDGSESIIKCGSYTGNGNADGPEINCGFEPQWLLIKRTSNTGHWRLYDSMRGWTVGNGEQELYPNLSAIEYAVTERFSPQSTGFKVTSSDPEFNGSGENYIYIAIRRPMKTPESGTEVFGITTYSGNSSTQTVTTTKTDSPSFVGDLFFGKSRSFATDFVWTPRLTGYKGLDSNSTSAEQSEDVLTVGRNDVDLGYVTANLNYSGQTYVGYLLSRATGFFDVVAYTGDGLDGRTVDHNLKAVPELLIVKSRSSAYTWRVLYYDGVTGLRLNLNDNSAATTATGSIWGNSSTFIAPTSTQFTVSNYSNVNLNNATFVAYLFATLAGVSKVGSYTGSNNVGPQTIDCGFSTGARFVLIKNTGIGEWFVFDVERGITVGSTDGVLQLQSTSQEYTEAAWGGGDMIQPHPSGFTLTTNGQLNSYTSTYIFLAIA